MQIKNAKILDNTVELSFERREDDGSTTTGSEKYSRKFHPDLRTAYDNLRIHLGLLTGCIGLKAIKNIETPPAEIVEQFFINGFSHKTGDDEGVVLKGYRKLENGKTFNFNTPFYRYNESDESQYKFIDDLKRKIKRAEEETALFISGEKVGDDPQLQLPLQEGAPQNRDPEDLELVNEGADEVWAGGKRPEID